MSWIEKLQETYDQCQSMIGGSTNDDEVPLLPICHTTQKAQIEITLDENGHFRRARVVPREEARTIIPCTESSSGRTSGEAAHPLCDKLQYVAKDFDKFVGEKDSYFESYLEQMTEWTKFEKNKKVQSVLDYINRGNVITDLVENGVLFADQQKLLYQRNFVKNKNANLDIFDLLPGRWNKQKKAYESWQADAFVRWKVELPNDPQSSLWADQEIIGSWIKYYTSTKDTQALCYVTGEIVSSADQHPAKLRNDGDKAKIISSNDNSGFTFRGRFTKADQVVNVGFVTTQKAHSALRWLIDHQGYRKDDLAIVAWATSGAEIPSLVDDSASVYGFDHLESDQESRAYTAQDVGIKLKKRIAGYGKNIGDTTDIIVISLDSIVPGRLSITYYRELTGSDFLQRIEDWHTTGAWLHTYRSVMVQDQRTGKLKPRFFPFYGAPSPGDIAVAAYGVNRSGKFEVDNKLLKTTVQRLLPCIVDGLPIPRDLVESALRRASNRAGLEEWQFNKALSIACWLFNKHTRKEKYQMTLDLNRKTRDYLYGRLLALAESLEEWALNKANEDRPTNAARLMQRFSERPYSTWRTIELALSPYKARLGGKSKKRQSLIDEVIAAFEPDDFISDKRLSGEFLLGYHSQREFLRNNRNEEHDGVIELPEVSNNY